MSEPIWWEPKDADEAKTYAIDWYVAGSPTNALADGDKVVSSVWSDVNGVVLEADTISDDGFSTQAHVSGGANGTQASLLNTVETENGETLEQVVYLPIVVSGGQPLGEYDVPRPEHLMAMYPAFADVPYQTVAIHIQTAAANGVDTSWLAADYAPAIMALAAHNMALLNIGDHGEAAGYRRQGVTAIRDGAFNVQFSERAASRGADGAFSSTPYGQQYAVMLKRNRGGPRVVGPRLAPGDWGYRAQQNNGYITP